MSRAAPDLGKTHSCPEQLSPSFLGRNPPRMPAKCLGPGLHSDGQGTLPKMEGVT